MITYRDLDLEVALRCSDLAGSLALDYFGHDVQSETKVDGSIVTEADRAVEALLCEELLHTCPNDAVLGEETGSRGVSDRVWILDPIDGTSCFAERNPHWRVHVVLQVDGDFKVAVVTAPALGIQWWAAKGLGAFESPWPRQESSPVQLAVSTTGSLEHCVLAGDTEAARVRLGAVSRVAAPSPNGWCGGLIDLVRGDVDCFLSEGHQFWDHAPWRLLVEEAGGRFTKKLPNELHGGGVYSNGHIHEHLLSTLGYPAVRRGPDS